MVVCKVSCLASASKEVLLCFDGVALFNRCPLGECLYPAHDCGCSCSELRVLGRSHYKAATSKMFQAWITGSRETPTMSFAMKSKRLGLTKDLDPANTSRLQQRTVPRLGSATKVCTSKFTVRGKPLDAPKSTMPPRGWRQRNPDKLTALARHR